MPFVTDIFPPSREMEAAAGLGLAVDARKSKGFLGKKQHEAIEVLGRFSLPLLTVSWEKREDGCTSLVFDPQGLLTGSVNFDLTTDVPQAELKEDLLEDDFVALCQQMTKTASDFSADKIDFTGLLTEPDQVQQLLKDDGQSTVAAGLEQTVDTGQVVEALRNRLAGYDTAAAGWAGLKQQFLAHRDRQVVKINEAADEARAAAAKSLEELEEKVKAALAAKRSETEAAAEEARTEHGKQKEMFQSELDRFKQQFEEDGDNSWRDKIKAEEQRLADNDKKLASTLKQLDEAEKKYAATQQDQIKQLKSEADKRIAAFDQRIKKLNTALEALEKGVDKRLERLAEQEKKVTGLTVTLTGKECDKEFPVVFYAARYPGDRWQVFPPQLYGSRGIGGKVSGLLGGINLPFRPASRIGDSLAAKIEAMLPGHDLEAALVEQNLINNPGFVEDARAGLANLIEQNMVNKKHANLFEEY